MSEESRTVASLKGQLSKFSGIISKGVKKPNKWLIKEMLNGIQSSKDVKLSNIARKLREDQPLIKTEDRLSRNLDDEVFTEWMNEEICRFGASKVTDDMVIGIDPGDLRKRYVRKMEFLGKVWDGSDKEVREGYCLCVLNDNPSSCPSVSNFDIRISDFYDGNLHISQLTHSLHRLLFVLTSSGTLFGVL